jgi:hypothetical protein
MRPRDRSRLQSAHQFSANPNIYNNLGNLLFARQSTQTASIDIIRTQFWHSEKAGASVMRSLPVTCYLALSFSILEFDCTRMKSSLKSDCLRIQEIWESVRALVRDSTKTA